MQTLFAGVIHQVAQIEQQCFAQILDPFFAQPVLQRKERMTGKTQRRVVQTERFKIVPCLHFFFLCEKLWQARHEKQHVGLLHNFISL
mgnify:CR=1 FL=1